ncbi:hypothetical protein ACHAWF_014425 [Thalassiosira exigua]
MKTGRAHSFVLLLAGMGIQSTLMGFIYLYWLTSNDAYMFASKSVDAPVSSGSISVITLRDEKYPKLAMDVGTNNKIQDRPSSKYPEHSRMSRGRGSRIGEQTRLGSSRTGVISRSESPDATNSESLSATAAIAMISIGTSEKQTKLTRRCIRSIRKAGKYSGHILLVTDSKELAKTVQGDDKVEIFPVDPETVIFDRKDQWKKGNVKISAASKRFKMRLLDMMDSKKKLAGYKWLLYVDIDVVIGKPLKYFFDYVQQRTLGHSRSVDKMFSSYLLHFHEEKKWKGDTQCAHGGIFLLNRQKSRHCLSLWEKAFRSGEHHMDQSALAEVVCNSTAPQNATTQNDCGVGFLSNKRFLLKPTKQTMKEGKSATFIHITSTNRASPGSKGFIPWGLQVQFLTKIVGLEESIAVPAHKKKKTQITEGTKGVNA